MSNYTSTYTEQDGIDDVEAADFSTEFDAIAAAIGTKADVDGDTITNATVQGGVIHPQALVTTTGGTTVTITNSIPSWADRVVITLHGVSTSSTSDIVLQIGTSGGIDTTADHVWSYMSVDSGGTSVGASNTGTYFNIVDDTLAAVSHTGVIILQRHGTGNVWNVESRIGSDSSTTGTTIMTGSKALSAALTQARLNTKNGAPTFDAVSIGVAWS